MSFSHPSQGAQVFAAMVVIAIVLLWLSLRIRRRERLVRDLPTSKVQGVFIGLVELSVTAESEKPLTSYLGGRLCVHYSYRVDEHWRRTVSEAYTDDKGQPQTRTRVEEGWKTIAAGGAAEPFYGRDETGVILIRPEGAKFEGVGFFDRTVTKGDPLYATKATPIAVPDSTGERRFAEEGIPLHAPIFVVGQARERDDVVAPEIAASKAAAVFLISTRSKKGVEVSYAVYSWLAWAGGLAASALGGFLAVKALRPAWAPVSGALGLGALFLAAWAAGWALMVFNSLVGLRARVRQGWSLIEVELKRRHDLIPNLAVAVAGLSSHEASVQTAVAALRAQLTATRPGEPGPDISGVAGVVRAVAEKYPNLVAQEGFSRLQKQLVETEQRIALTRTYYNDIAAQFATRVAQVPDAWLAAAGGIRAEPLLQAADFERAPVSVNLATAPSAQAGSVAGGPDRS
jgi:hypothetical protein